MARMYYNGEPIGNNSQNSGGGGVNSPSLTEEQVQQLIDDAISKIDIPVADAVPSGVICAWSGSTTNVPIGWALCDGTNGTPDLRGRFVIGVNTTYTKGKTGGSSTVKLTAQQMPSHTHGENFSGLDTSGTVSMSGPWKTGASVTSGSAYSIKNSSFLIVSGGDVLKTASTGSDEAHDNMPPYYALAYIMKL